MGTSVLEMLVNDASTTEHQASRRPAGTTLLCWSSRISRIEGQICPEGQICRSRRNLAKSGPDLARTRPDSGQIHRPDLARKRPNPAKISQLWQGSGNAALSRRDVGQHRPTLAPDFARSRSSWGRLRPSLGRPRPSLSKFGQRRWPEWAKFGGRLWPKSGRSGAAWDRVSLLQPSDVAPRPWLAALPSLVRRSGAGRVPMTPLGRARWGRVDVARAPCRRRRSGDATAPRMAAGTASCGISSGDLSATCNRRPRFLSRFGARAATCSPDAAVRCVPSLARWGVPGSRFARVRACTKHLCMLR